MKTELNFISTMQHQKCSLKLYSNFLLGNQNRYSGVELSKVSPDEMAHDAVSRWLFTINYTPLATNHLTLTDYDEFISHFQNRWRVEEFHRGLKQTTGIEKCYSIKAASQQTHIFASFVAFVKLDL